MRLPSRRRQQDLSLHRKQVIGRIGPALLLPNCPVVVVCIDKGRIDVAVQFEVNAGSRVPVVDEEDPHFEGNGVVISSRDGASYVGEVTAGGEGGFVAEEGVITAAGFFFVRLGGRDL